MGYRNALGRWNVIEKNVNVRSRSSAFRQLYL